MKNYFHTSRKFISIVHTTLAIVFIFMLVGCSGSGDSGGGTQQDDTGGNTVNAPGSGDTATGGDSSGSGSNSGGTGTGTGTDGSGTGTGGTGTGGTTGGDTSGGGTLGSLAALYVNTGNIDLAVTDCTSLPASLIFTQAVFALINQSGNSINAAITLSPSSTATTTLDQMVLTLSGQFTNTDTVTGTFTAISSLNNQVVAQSQGDFIIVVTGAIISVELVRDNTKPDCSLSGGMLLDEDTSSAGGTGGTGGGTGGTGGTGGDTGGGTGGTGGGTGGSGGSGDILIITEEGDFGSLQFQSTVSADDAQQFNTTSATFLRIPDGDFFVWSNGNDVAVQVNLISGNSVVNAISGKDYSCVCFPLIDLATRQVTFNNFTLTKVGDSLTLNGTLTIPQFAQQP